MIKSLKMFTLAVGAAILLAFSTSAARADSVLYGVTYFGNHLIQIDPTTQAGTDIGALSTPMSPFGLATRNGRLFTFDSRADLVREINPLTAATTASFGIGIGPVLGQGGLAFRSDGIGFLSSALNPATLNPAMNLYRFDIAAGTSSLVGTSSHSLSALAFSPGGTLFGLGKEDGSLYSVNQSTAALTLIGNIAGTPGSPVEALTFSPNGTLFATIDDRLFTVNTATGVGTAIDPDPTNDVGFSSISGLAFSAVSVPEPSSIFLFGGGLVALSVSAWRRHKRRRSATN